MRFRSKQSWEKWELGDEMLMAASRGVFDISLIASIASHLSYWGDEDVNHFIISQLLSRQRVMKKGKGKQQWSSVRIDE